MKQSLRIFFSLLLIVAFVFALSAPVVQAQQYAVTTLLSGGTQNIAGGATSNYNTTIGLTKYAEVGVQTAFKLTGAGTENIITTFEFGLDGSNWETIKTYKWTNAANGTTLVVASTNIYMGSVGYLRLKSIVNGSSGEAVTNLLMQYSVKPKREG